MADLGEGAPLFLDQNEARRAEKKFFWGQATPLSHGLDDRSPSPPPLIWRSGFATLFCLCFKLINICVLVWVGTWRPTVVFLARLLLASSRNHGEDYGNEKITKCNRLNKQNKNSELAAGLFDRFLYRHHTTNVVKRHRSGNSAILAFISKIVVWLNGIVATSIPSEIPILSVTLTAILQQN